MLFLCEFSEIPDSSINIVCNLWTVVEYLSDASLEPELRLAVGEALLLEGDADVNRSTLSPFFLPLSILFFIDIQIQLPNPV